MEMVICAAGRNGCLRDKEITIPFGKEKVVCAWQKKRGGLCQMGIGQHDEHPRSFFFDARTNSITSIIIKQKLMLL